MTDIAVPGGTLYVGGMEACNISENKSPYRPTIHACKYPCYWTAVGKQQYHLGDKEYLYALRAWQQGRDGERTSWQDLFLNMIDPKKPLFYEESFETALNYIDEALAAHKSVIIHCNRGLSRAPAIAYIWLARNGVIPKVWYSAVGAMEKLYPAFNPGDGILAFMWENWKELVHGS